MGIRVTKGGRGPVGSAVKAPGGKYIHKRKKSPKKYTKYITVTTNRGNKVRLGWNPRTKKWEAQSVLIKIKNKK